jgi:glycosyltransferase involved in cell wall biosynthesis
MTGRRKIKILFIIDYLTAGGGTENQVKALISNLDRKRFEPFLVTLAPMVGWEGLPAYHDPGCDHMCLELRKIKSSKAVIDILKLARLIRRREFDIVQTFFVDANIVGVIAGFLGRCKAIVVSRRDLGFWYTPKKLFILRTINRLADHFMVNSNAVKNTVARRENVDPRRIRVIHNGFFDVPDNGQSNLRKSDFGIREDSPVVGVVANLRRIKRLDNFIRVAAAIGRNDVHFMVIGTGSMKDDLRAQAIEAGVGDRFHFTHTLGNIYDYIKLFDIGVLTSDSEGLSNTIIEYQLCGKPAVAFDVGGNNEIIDNEQTGFLIKHGDLDGMRRKIEVLLSDGSLRERFGLAGVAQARRKFSGERMIKDTCDFYEEITNTS